MTQSLATIEDVDGVGDVGEERFVFEDADWAFYELILKRVVDRRVFVTFDGERLEVMSPSPEHERNTSRLEKLVWILFEELRVDFESLGSFTLKNRKANRGLEPDRCFYTRNANAIRHKRRIVLGQVPPPDLAIEIEVTRRLLDRVDVYERLGVPEVWCYDGQRLRILVLQSTGGYVDVPRSPTLPNLRPEEVHRLLQRAWEVGEPSWVEEVRAWIRQNLLKPAQ